MAAGEPRVMAGLWFTVETVAPEAGIDLVGQAVADAVRQPVKVILFGSRARGDAAPDSDVDLLLIEREVAMTFSARAGERIGRFERIASCFSSRVQCRRSCISSLGRPSRVLRTCGAEPAH